MFQVNYKDAPQQTIVCLDSTTSVVVWYMRRFARFGNHFVQFKKREKHPWSSVTFSKVVTF